jgi:hypothetical protein
MKGIYFPVTDPGNGTIRPGNRKTPGGLFCTRPGHKSRVTNSLKSTAGTGRKALQEYKSYAPHGDSGSP